MTQSELEDIARVTFEDDRWEALVRYDHKFDDDTVAEETDVSNIAQGATAVVRDGRVHRVILPDHPFRDEDEVEDVALQIARDIETDP